MAEVMVEGWQVTDVVALTAGAGLERERARTEAVTATLLSAVMVGAIIEETTDRTVGVTVTLVLEEDAGGLRAMLIVPL